MPWDIKPPGPWASIDDWCDYRDVLRSAPILTAFHRQQLEEEEYRIFCLMRRAFRATVRPSAVGRATG
jgi:hypothetical protein